MISIVTPSYNQGEFLEAAIRSVLLQGYPALEYIIIDGGSTDESLEIIKSYEPWLTYWVSEMDDGQGSALNKGFERATGEVAGWLNADDQYLPGAFAKVAARWDGMGMPIALVTGTKLKGNSNLERITRLPQLPHTVEHLTERNILEQPATFFPLRHFRAVGGVDERYHITLDYELWLRMTRFGANIEFIDDDLAITRLHSQTKTSLSQRTAALEALQSVWANYRLLPDSWVKKLVTVFVVPASVRWAFLRRWLYYIRDGLCAFARHPAGKAFLSAILNRRLRALHRPIHRKAGKPDLGAGRPKLLRNAQ